MQRTRGVSLAKGPIALVGLLGIIYGLTALIVRAHSFALHFPNGHVHGPLWIHLMVNGWTSLLFIAAGLALLFSAAAHITAKTMAMLVGIVLIVLAIIAYAQGHGALGIFAADHWTELIWGVAGIVLVLLALMPRVGGRTVGPAPVATTTATRRGVEGERVVRREPVSAREPVAGDEPMDERDRVERRGAADGREPVAGRETTAEGDEPLVRREETVPARDTDDEA